MMLVEEGKLRLADPALQYLPEFRNARMQPSGGPARPPARDITIQDLLLTHRGSATAPPTCIASCVCGRDPNRCPNSSPTLRVLLNKGTLDGVGLLSPATVETMTKNGLPELVPQGKGGAVGWGLANVDVVVGPGSGGYLTTIGEYGWDGSAGTFFAVDPSRDLVVTLMTQNLPANPDGLRQKFKAAVLESVIQ